MLKKENYLSMCLCTYVCMLFQIATCLSMPNDTPMYSTDSDVFLAELLHLVNRLAVDNIIGYIVRTYLGLSANCYNWLISCYFIISYVLCNQFL